MHSKIKLISSGVKTIHSKQVIYKNGFIVFVDVDDFSSELSKFAVGDNLYFKTAEIDTVTIMQTPE